MSTSNDRVRYPLNDDLERRLDAAEPAWVRRFIKPDKPEPARPSRRNRQLETALGLMLLFTAFGCLLGRPGVAVVSAAAAIVLFRIRFLP